MMPPPAACLLDLALPALQLDAPEVPLGVIPGIAPSLIAVLPQLILLLLGTIALVFSPAVWWRLGAAALRRPLRSAAVLGAGASVVYGAVWLAPRLPRPAPGEAIPETVEGFPIGDPHAARCRSTGPGPASSLVAFSPPAFEALGGAVERLEVLGERVLLVTRGGEEVACADPVRGEVLWRRKLGAPPVAGPLGFERLDGTGAAGSGLVVATAPGAPRPAGVLSVLDAKDGADSARLDLPSAPTRHAALVDDLVLLALEGTVAAYSLSGPGAPRLAWNAPRPAREARGLAGDPSGSFYLLDGEALLAGDIRDGSSRELARFEPGSPARLAVRDGRACVLTAGPGEEARVHCIDPTPRGSRPDAGAGGAVVWSMDAGRPVGDDLCIAAFGVVLTLPRELRVLDLLTGERLGSLPLEAPPACPAAAGDLSAYLLLAGGRVRRWAPGLDRRDGSIDPAAPAALPEDSPPAAGDALVVAGDRLVAGSDGKLRVISGGEGVRSSPWSHYRGGADRAGTCDGARMPLRARVLWRRGARGDGGAGGPVEGLSGGEGAEVSVLPLSEGWLVAAPSGGRTRHAWLDDGGSLLGERSDEGETLGAVRSEGRIFAAMGARDAEGAVLCLGARRQSDGTSLRELWRAPTPPLAGSRPIASGEDLVIVALRSSILALSPGDGRRRWESRAVAGARVPLCAGGRVFVPGDGGEGGGVLVALAAADGRLLWRRGEPGWRCGPATLHGEAIAVPAVRGGRGRIDLLRPGDGSVLRSIALEVEAAAGPLAAAGAQVFYAGRSGGAFLLPADGKAPVRLAPGENRTGGVPPLPPILGFDLVAVAAGPALRCLDTLSLDTVWEAALPAPPVDGALERGLILVAAGGEVLCLGAD